MLKRVIFLFLIVMSSLLVAQALVEVEQSVQATVTINEVQGELKVFPELLETNAAPLAIVEKELNLLQ